MSIPEFTTVLGVDLKHLAQLQYTYPTWVKHKPQIEENPMVIFYDLWQTNDETVRRVIPHPNLKTFGWPACDPQMYEPTEPLSKWNAPQRYKMLAGFVHVPKLTVETPYWLKIDTDTIAAGEPDWIDPGWFENDPAIVSHPWGFTKPANQMMLLDKWVEENPGLTELVMCKPLDLKPKTGASRVSHKRIISWCGFFETKFTSDVSDWCNATAGAWRMPVRSQDGIHWYCAKRLGRKIVRANMKDRGWEHWSTMKNITRRFQEITGMDP
jgi:hypothetical protein